jgi:phosphoenolpyruvate synthase/pyruvate phosphate dikinase
MTLLGGKAANLVRLRDEFKLYVPEFEAVLWNDLFSNYATVAPKLNAVTTKYLSGALTDSQLKKQATTLASSLTLNNETVQSVHAVITKAGWKKVSFRTSALHEDGAEHSFAGQYESYVDRTYTRAAFKKYIVACFNSMLSLRVVSYAKARGFAELPIGGSLIIQEMFYGTQSGVAFTEDGSGNATIAYVDSWKNTVVDGEEATTIVAPKSNLAGARLQKHLLELLKAGACIEAATARPVDIEWAYDGTTLAFLQFRPQTTTTTADLLKWDNTNIAENYPGITLPLTYSFIRTLYARVYPSFFRLMGTPERTLARKAPVFDNMLGYIEGRVYYRISNWYEVVKLIPGRRNQLYFEAMLNPVEHNGAAKQRQPLDLASMSAMVHFVWLLLRSPAHSKRFKRSIQTKLDAYDTYQWQAMRTTAIVASIKEIRQELLSLWAIPILNDIRVMIFHGILKTAFFGEKHRASYLSYLAGLTDRASLKPLEALSTLGAKTHEIMKHESVSSLKELQKTTSWPQVAQLAKAYTNDFGARTPDELKLENERLTDSPISILDLALNAITQPADSRPPGKVSYPAHLSPLLRPVLWFVARNTRSAIDWRERFRFNRAQVFNIARRAYIALGEHLHKEGVIAKPRDIFWLTEQEIDEIVNGHAWMYKAKAVISGRKKEFASYEKNDTPTGLQGHGVVAALHTSPVLKVSDGDTSLHGAGVAPGQLTASVVVATSFDPTLDVRGKILVVGHIDPGWTVLFTQAAAVITERGNALSHAAIIAREIGIPAIVAVLNITSILKTGDTITIDGISGTITQHEKHIKSSKK